MKNNKALRLMEITKAVSIAQTIELASNFNQSMSMVSKYPILVQYLRLSEIVYLFMEDMHKKTNDDFWLKSMESFNKDTQHNLECYIDKGNSNDELKTMVVYLKESLKSLFDRNTVVMS